MIVPAVDSQPVLMPEGSGERAKGTELCYGVNPFVRDAIVCWPVSLSLCLACHGFLAAQLFPTWLMLNSNKSSTLAPAGNRRRRTSSGRSVIQMHGVKNIVQCFLVIFWVKSGMSVVDSPAACLQRYTLTAQLAEIMGCMNGERGNKLMHHNTQLLEALKPPHKYMPEILLDGEDMDERKPAVCKDKGLSPAIPKTESLPEFLLPAHQNLAPQLG
uniref:Uncharacterized protein n=1 Tax=Gopherus evgoodei TaxID=1825980 RepID=A0A8C4WK88_9SAUR